MHLLSKIFTFLIAFWLIAASNVIAQVELDTTIVLPDVTVTATRTETTTSSAPSRVTVIDAEAITATGGQTVADVLDNASGAFVKRYGDGGLSTLSLRGAGASQIAILLDGHRLTDPQLGQVDLNLLPTLLVNSIEVMHGAGSSLYGTDAVGGVVNIQSRQPGNLVQTLLEYGAYGAFTGGLALSGTRETLSGQVALEYTGSQGDFPYLNSTLYPPREMRREGADQRRFSAYASAGLDRNQHASRLALWYGGAERGLPGLATSPQRGERQWDEQFRAWFDHDRRVGWGNVKFGSVIHYGALRYLNPYVDVDDTGRTLLSSAEMEANVLVNSHWLLTTGVSGTFSQANHPQLSSDAREYHSAVFASGTGSFGSFLIYPAFRLDAHVPHGGEARFPLSPRIGFNWQPFTSPKFFIKAQVARSFRMPTLNDRYWQPGGNPNLQPERGWSYDAGVFVQTNRGVGEVTVFGSRVRDQIIWEPKSSSFHVPENVSRVRVRGVEVSYRQLLLSKGTNQLSGRLFYTFTDARDQSDPNSLSYGQPVRYVPREQLTAQIAFGTGPVQIDLNARYCGRRYLTADATQYLDPFIVLDAQARVTGNLKAFQGQLALVIENALDTRYAIVQHYPMPPRHARLRLLLRTRSEND